jgi:hypothetical protein
MTVFLSRGGCLEIPFDADGNVEWPALPFSDQGAFFPASLWALQLALSCAVSSLPRRPDIILDPEPSQSACGQPGRSFAIRTAIRKKSKGGSTSIPSSVKWHPPFERVFENLLLGFAGNDRFGRALFCAGSTVGAEIGIDYILVLSLTDRSNGALILTGTTGQTLIGNYVRHNVISFFNFVDFLS